MSEWFTHWRKAFPPFCAHCGMDLTRQEMDKCEDCLPVCDTCATKREALGLPLHAKFQGDRA